MSLQIIILDFIFSFQSNLFITGLDYFCITGNKEYLAHFELMCI